MKIHSITDLEPSDLETGLYLYRIRNAVAADGDTIKAIWDLGDGLQKEYPFRLYGINTPESVRPTEDGERERGLAAKQWLQAALDAHSDGAGWILGRTIKDRREKFGRMLIELVSVATGSVVSLNRELVRQGYALPYLLGPKSLAPAWLLEAQADWDAAQADGVHRFAYLDAKAAAFAAGDKSP